MLHMYMILKGYCFLPAIDLYPFVCEYRFLSLMWTCVSLSEIVPLNPQ